MIHEIANSILIATAPKYAITLIQPWATLIMTRGKDIENRSWAPDSRLQVGDRLWIHAGNTVDKRICEFAKLDPASLPKGVLLGHVQYNGTCTDSKSVWKEPGTIGWMISDPIDIPHIQCKGHQKIWVVPQDIITEIYASR